MIINLFSSGAKILKIGTLFVATVLLLLILFVSFVAVFPSTFKDTVQEQLSTHSGFDIELSDISLGIEDGSVTVLFDKVGIFPQEKDIPVASVKDLQWNIDLSTLYDNIDISKFVSNFDMADMVDNIYRPNAVYIDNLIINDNYKYSRDVFGVKDIAKLFSSESLKVLYFIKSLRINKMQFQSKDNFDISTVNIERDNYQLLLTTYNQDLSFNNKFPALKQVDITATLAADQTDIKNYITVPVKISNGEADIYGNFRVISNREDDLIEYEGYIPTIEANQIPKYFSEELIGKDKYKQLSSTVFSGKLNNLKLNFSSRASKNGLIKSRLSTNIENVDISNNQVIESINDLNGSINTNFTDMRVILESAIVDGIRISDGEIRINNLGNPGSTLYVIANIDSKSEELIKFVRKMKVGDSIRNALDKFTLNGKVSGVSKLEMPLNGGKKNIEFDLNVTGNKLKTLGNDIVVEDFSSNIVYKDNQVSTDGRGFFRGIHFDIDLNPNNYYEEEEYLLKLRLVNRTSGSELHLRKYNDNLWLARIESESISGDIVVDLNNNEVPYIEINNLNILSVDSIGGDWDISSGDIPSMRIAVQGINIDDKVNAIPNFKANLISSNDTLLIKDLVFDGVGINNEESLSFNGAWLPSGQTSIMASAKGNRLSDFLSKLNIEEDVSGGEFDFDVRLFCNCSPWNMNYKDIKGIMHLRAKEGVFTDRGPSFGRILSLLNIQSIAKRLQLDVSDVLQKGFAYDDIYAEILLEDSLAKIRRFDLNSTSSKIQLAGESNIVNKQYNIEAIVHPAISEAVPAATYIAGGGFIGLGIWLVDESLFDGKILDYIADKVIEIKYKISGPWSDPAIDFISFNELL